MVPSWPRPKEGRPPYWCSWSAEARMPPRRPWLPPLTPSAPLPGKSAGFTRDLRTGEDAASAAPLAGCCSASSVEAICVLEARTWLAAASVATAAADGRGGRATAAGGAAGLPPRSIFAAAASGARWPDLVDAATVLKVAAASRSVRKSSSAAAFAVAVATGGEHPPAAGGAAGLAAWPVAVFAVAMAISGASSMGGSSSCRGAGAPRRDMPRLRPLGIVVVSRCTRASAPPSAAAALKNVGRLRRDSPQQVQSPRWRESCWPRAREASPKRAGAGHPAAGATGSPRSPPREGCSG